MNKTFRLDGFKQLDAFYTWLLEYHENKIRHTHIATYMAVFYYSNKCGWSEWVSIPYEFLMRCSNISSTKTYYRIISELQEYNLIRVRKGKNGFASAKFHIVKLERNTNLSIYVDNNQDSDLNNNLNEQLPTNIYNLLENNITIINNNTQVIYDNLKECISVLKNNNEELFEEIFLNFNSICTELPKVSELTLKRKKLISIILLKYSTAEIIEVLKKANSSEFLTQKILNSNFKATFDWIFNQENFLKIHEGNYENTKITAKTKESLIQQPKNKIKWEIF